MVMGDALAMAMVEARKFTVEEYAGNHPAGAIGRALTLKVEDVMRKGEAFAKVNPESTVLESLMAMTRAKSGCAVVADAQGALKGVFTDGDFRRIISSEGADASVVLSAPVSKYMTVSPRSIKSGSYAAEIVKVFEKMQIDDLPVVDGDGHAIGLVDIQDLPKMKVI
jgi:arabinose-5-phosphate isomerase